ncbi:MAG: hypothetical protein OEU36_26080 [Gammaproteobacteria bacterium]|nr:hypothetical protein [Gammaproteobacteria bacterium]
MPQSRRSLCKTAVLFVAGVPYARALANCHSLDRKAYICEIQMRFNEIPIAEREELQRRERRYHDELVRDGILASTVHTPDYTKIWALYFADGSAQMSQILGRYPLRPWFDDAIYEVSSLRLPPTGGPRKLLVVSGTQPDPESYDGHFLVVGCARGYYLTKEATLIGPEWEMYDVFA